MKFIGIGLGPGDSEYITLKAIKKIKEATTVIAAASQKSGFSLALSIAEEHINPGTEIIKAYFPMSNDEKITQKKYTEYIEIINQKIREKKTVAFLCIGDPLFYGTYGKLITLMQKTHPHIDIETVAGIPAFCAAAAKSNKIIAQNQDIFTVVPIHKYKDFSKQLEYSDKVLFMKVYKEKNNVIDEMQKNKSVSNILYVENTGLEKEFVSSEYKKIKNKESNYLSLLFVDKHENK